jgi:hypothetical protein
MNKTTLLTLLLITLLLTACGGNASNAAVPGSVTQGGPATGELSTTMQVAIGTIQLDATEEAVTTGQAAELLPLWETLQVLETSDTAAAEEIDALFTQIQETMTQEQMQAISALNLTRQDMFSIMQSQGMGLGGSQNGTTQRSGSSANNGRGFGSGGGGFAGGPPPDGGFGPGGNPNFQDQGSTAQSDNSTDNTNSFSVTDPNRIPTPLIQAVIAYLKTISDLQNQ